MSRPDEYRGSCGTCQAHRLPHLHEEGRSFDPCAVSPDPREYRHSLIACQLLTSEVWFSKALFAPIVTSRKWLAVALRAPNGDTANRHPIKDGELAAAIKLIPLSTSQSRSPRPSK